MVDNWWLYVTFISMFDGFDEALTFKYDTFHFNFYSCISKLCLCMPFYCDPHYGLKVQYSDHIAGQVNVGTLQILD